MTETNYDTKNNDPALKTHELLQILRGGTGALSRWDSDSSDKGLTAFLTSSVDDILARSKRTEDLREFKIKREVGEAVDNDQLARDVAEEEKRLFSSIAQVKTRYFEGQEYRKDDRAYEAEWRDMQKRQRYDRLVIVNGIESLPIPVMIISPKPVVKKEAKGPKFQHEDWCIECRDGGELVCCAWCPRVCKSLLRKLGSLQSLLFISFFFYLSSPPRLLGPS